IAAEKDTPYSGEELLFMLLHDPYFNIPAHEIARLSVEVYDRQYKKDKTFLRALLREKINTPPKDLFTPPVNEGVRRASDFLEKWIAADETLSPAIISSTAPATGTTEAAQAIATIPTPPRIAPLDTDFATALLKRFSMNVSALNSYLRCPLEFYYKNIIRIPSSQSEAAGFGSAVHHALEQLYKQMLEQGGTGRQRIFPPKEVFIQHFEDYMQAHRESFTTAQFAKKLNHGREVLSNYYDAWIAHAPTVVTIERMLRVTWNGIPLKGKIDKLEFDGRSVNIVDYKTGNYEKALRGLQPPNEDKPNGGDYWRQAVFYKLLVDNAEQKGWTAVSTTFDFIEPDPEGAYHRERILPGPADVTTVSQQITRAWEGIQARDFYTGCGKENCGWCGFVRESGLAVF
ncbi:MAG: PD-(D/E)XK nuclease family protein, partial [Bacteroidetes bacterium]|nr:PD-(D/E)XK nuclease family protein [Bacteroidota bacterium]